MTTEKQKNRIAFENAFPKTCGVCGKVYSNHDEFLKETSELNAGSLSQGPKESVLSYRNCSCGSTITIKVTDMRDNSEAGNLQREEFRKKLEVYLEKGMEQVEAVRLVKKEMGLD